MEFLTHVRIETDSAMSTDQVAELKREEASRAQQLAREGKLLRLWRPVTEHWENFGLWSVPNEGDLWAVLQTLPLFPYMTITVTTLLEHPSDPRLG
jgi:muconolactone D-isomerase